MLRTRLKEPFCGLSHGVGAVLSVVALVALLVMAEGRPLHLVGFAIYGASLIALYTASTLYHSLAVSPRASARLQRLDHCAIYLLIAGSYTPVCLIALRGAWGWGLLGAQYTLAILGIACSLLWHRAPDWLRVVLYVLMGWMVLLAFAPLRAALSSAGVAWLIAGGVVYSVGTLIFAMNKPHLWPGKFSARLVAFVCDGRQRLSFRCHGALCGAQLNNFERKSTVEFDRTHITFGNTLAKPD